MKTLFFCLIFGCLLSSTSVQATVFTVSTTDNFLTDGTTVSTGSLLDALQKAGNGDTIEFNIPGDGPHVIQTPQGGYPLIQVNDLTIDGYSQPGASPNTNPILGGNNAQLQIVLDSRSGPGQRTPLGPLNNPGYGNSESAVLGLLGAKNFRIKGISFLTRHTESSDSDPDIYCLAFVNDATGGRMQGCWFGLGPDGTTTGGGRSAVASFKGDGGTASSGMIIGTDGDGMDDPAEFNVIIEQALAIHLETPNVQVSGNYINVFPDGLHFVDVNSLADAIGDVESIENGEGHGMLIGTDGDGMDDANERNVFGQSSYSRTIEFWGAAATNVVVAGNFFGVGIDGLTEAPVSTFRNPDFIYLKENGSIRVGSNGDGVSDNLEGNLIYNVGGPNLIEARGSQSGDTITRAVVRWNKMVNNGFTSFPVSAAPANYYSDILVDSFTDPMPTQLFYFDDLEGVLPAANTAVYPYALVDVYLLDPRAYNGGLNLLQTRTYLGTFLEGSADDGNPAPDQFVFNLQSFTIPEDGLVSIAVTYSMDPNKTEVGRSVTGLLGAPQLAPATVNAPPLELTQSGGQMSFRWPGDHGQFVFHVEQSDSVSSGTWVPVPILPDVSTGWNVLSMDKPAAPTFFRLSSQ